MYHAPEAIGTGKDEEFRMEINLNSELNMKIGLA